MRCGVLVERNGRRSDPNRVQRDGGGDHDHRQRGDDDQRANRGARESVGAGSGHVWPPVLLE